MRLVLKKKGSPWVCCTEALSKGYDSAAGARRTARHVSAIVPTSVVLHPRGDEVMVAEGVVNELLYLWREVSASLLLRHDGVPHARVNQRDAKLLELPLRLKVLDCSSEQARAGGPDDLDVGGGARARVGSVGKRLEEKEPERMPRLGREDGIHKSARHVAALFVREDGPVARQHWREGAEALDVKVGIDPAVVVDDEVARRIGALDIRGVAIEVAQEP
eukprot:CAMPEP_0119355322 /NCGR_PEP_ID=MMETSP1334-20130426/4168_1 /TAXON_ID=127549 /ORGANISM="Calcidiscus leptoporus, Strain RCC1130" /LENGTH=218 /DNA_ID=CAMNT_0007369115 /DNA_START=121 /DNA_END=777 /DNA_ORIENTATION=-